MSSETKVPMPETLLEAMNAFDVNLVKIYGDARASERDAYWMAKVVELERDVKRLDCLVAGAENLKGQWWFPPKPAWKDGKSMTAREAIDATLTNARAGETA